MGFQSERSHDADNPQFAVSQNVLKNCLKKNILNLRMQRKSLQGQWRWN